MPEIEKESGQEMSVSEREIDVHTKRGGQDRL